MSRQEIPFYRFMLSDIHDEAPRDHSIDAERMLQRLMDERSAATADYVREYLTPEHFPLMSLDPGLHQLLAASSVIWLMTRCSVSCGLDEFHAFGLSTYYTRRLSAEVSRIQAGEILSEAADRFLEALREQDDTGAGAMSPLVSAASSYVLRNIRSPLSVKNISEALFCSADYLSGRFRCETGQRLGDFIRHHKIELAREMLRLSDFPVGEIATALSFSSTSHLIRVFHKETGMTPGEYRKANSTFQKSPFYKRMYGNP